MKKRIALISSILLTSAISFSFLINLSNNDKGTFISREYESGPMFYAASYSSSFTSEPKYLTQKQYTFDSMNLGTTYNSYRGDSVKVAVIDSGINYAHEDFKLNNVSIVEDHSRSIEYSSTAGWQYFEYYNNASHLDDGHGHGTNVASVIASQINSIGCAGIAPNVELYVYKVTNANFGYEWNAINNALQYCIDNDIDVINMSFQAYEHAVSYGSSSMSASTGCSTQLTTMINKCCNAGITLVAAAGNFNTSEPSYPASNDHVISVGSLAESSTTTKADYSNLSNIDLVAPGTVYVAGRGSTSTYVKNSGTSFSAPIVTAAIALYKQKYPNATPAQIEQALYDSCDPISNNPSWAGNGRLNLASFVVGSYPTDIVLNNVSNDSLELEVGQEFTLNYTVNGVGDYSSEVGFTLLNDDGTITIDENGKITANKEGEEYLEIYCVDDPNISVAIDISVTAPAGPTTLDISPTSLSIFEGGSGQITANTTPEDTITFTSSNTTIATVNSSGLVSAKKAGTCTISVSANGLTRYCDVTVSAPTTTTISVDTTVTTQRTTSTETQVIFANSPFTFILEKNNSSTKANNYAPNNGKTRVYSGQKITLSSGTSKVSKYIINSAVSDKGLGGINNGTFTNATKVLDGNTLTIYPIDNSQPVTIVPNDTATITSIDAYIITKQISSISIKTPPTKTTYVEGDNFNPTGLVITVTYSDSSTEDISYASQSSEFSFNPTLTTALTTSNTSVTITYKGKSVTQDITVNKDKVLSYIEISGTYKTSFVRGDSFTFTGTVTAYFDNSTSLNVTNEATISGYNALTLGNQTITISYTYKGVTKSSTYVINVSDGTLSSISLSGQSTSYLKGQPFSFDGTCTAHYENGYSETVTPTSVTSPNMNIPGEKEITVSYTYNNVTKTAKYVIVVSEERTVIDYASVLETITYTTEEVISDNNISVTKANFTAIENNSIRLGSGSNTGKLTISHSLYKITSVTITAKAYGSDSDVKLNLGGEQKTLTSSYTQYSKTFSGEGVSSFDINTTANKKRAYISAINVYVYKPGQDISDTEDCVGLETFISDYMHMYDEAFSSEDYVGECDKIVSENKNVYQLAKEAFNALNDHQRSLFVNNSAYQLEWNRLNAWANHFGEGLISNNKLGASYSSLFQMKNTSVSSAIIFISILSISILAGYIYISKKKQESN